MDCTGGPKGSVEPRLKTTHIDCFGIYGVFKKSFAGLKNNIVCLIFKLEFLFFRTGTEHVFSLCGVGESPMALDHVVIPCKCREATECTVSVPNYAPHKLAYKVLTDIPCLDGPNIVSVMKVMFVLIN